MSRRGALDGLPTGHPLLHGLPALYHDDFTRRLTAAFDQVLAPIFATLDNLHTYVDPALAPPDFLDWLGNWLAITDALPASIERRRRIIAGAARLYAWQGTTKGIRELITLCTGQVPEITDPGSTRWSAEPGSEPPGPAQPTLIIRLRDGGNLEPHTLATIVATAVPAHLPYRIELGP